MTIWGFMGELGEPLPPLHLSKKSNGITLTPSLKVFMRKSNLGLYHAHFALFFHPPLSVCQRHLRKASRRAIMQRQILVRMHLRHTWTARIARGWMLLASSCMGMAPVKFGSSMTRRGKHSWPYLVMARATQPQQTFPKRA